MRVSAVFALLRGSLDRIPMAPVASHPAVEVEPRLNLDCNVRPGDSNASGLWPVPASIPRNTTSQRWR